MIKLLKLLIWSLLVLAVLAGVDQFFLQGPLRQPGLSQVQQFYVDFRSRVLGLARRETPGQSIEKVIQQTAVSQKPNQAKAQRYLYADENGVLQFADSLEQVPPRFRQDAQPLSE